jgi:heme exporter protein C
MLKRAFVPCLAVASVMLAVAPVLIARAEYESTMGLVQKIFYYHAPSAQLFLVATLACGAASALFLFGGRARADHVAVSAAELAVVFGIITLVTGPLWARKAWGVWWQWDARLTSSLVLWMTLVAYLLLRRFGGPGSDKLAAGVALFCMANVPFVYWSVNFWRTVHPRTTVVPTLPVSFGVPYWWSLAALLLFFLALLAIRLRLEEQRARLEELYLALED